MKRALLIACGVLGVVGCGSKERAPIYDPGNPDSGPSEDKDAAPREDAGKSNGPELKFTMPDPAKDPKDDTLVTSGMVTVRCRATQRTGSKAKVASVAITLDKVEDGKEEKQPATTKVGDTDEYEAKFDVSNRPNGVLTFQCVAKDGATTPNSSSITLATLLDLGPMVVIEEPKDQGSYPLRTPVTVKFQVTPQPLGDDDEEGAVKSVKLLVSGTEQEITEAEDKPGLYQASIDFNDKTLFMVAPTSAEIIVAASNGRTPEAATRTSKADVKIDGDGPAIKIETPQNEAMVHGEVLLKVTVTDASGVKPGSLNASINDTLLKITDWDVMGDSYQHTFDTRAFGYELTELTINLSATDVVGNQTDPPASIRVRLDNVPPIVDLDPPLIREYREDLIKNDNKYYCSKAFDPVGDLAVNDLEMVDTTSAYFRVLVEDQTNRPTGSLLGYYATVAPDKVVLYAQPDPTLPLLIDSNGDGVCDEINFADLPENKRPTIVKLSPVQPRGASYFSKVLDDGPGASCIADPTGAEVEPDPLCPGTEMRRVIRGRGEDKPAAVYALSPTNGPAGECEGGAWGVRPIVGKGWRCLAARAEDGIGNVGVSAPLRVCFNDDADTLPCDPASAPSCTKACTMSPLQSYGPNILWNDLLN
jgi:hypothetical protein